MVAPLLQAVEQAVRVEGRLRIGTRQQLVEDRVRYLRLLASRHLGAPSLPSCPPAHEIPDGPCAPRVPGLDPLVQDRELLLVRHAAQHVPSVSVIAASLVQLLLRRSPSSSRSSHGRRASTSAASSRSARVRSAATSPSRAASSRRSSASIFAASS